jgi:hypothetical protein
MLPLYFAINVFASSWVKAALPLRRFNGYFCGKPITEGSAREGGAAAGLSYMFQGRRGCAKSYASNIGRQLASRSFQQSRHQTCPSGGTQKVSNDTFGERISQRNSFVRTPFIPIDAIKD